jgi:hypothetical protein
VDDSLFDQDSSGPTARVASLAVTLAYVVSAYFLIGWVRAIEVAGCALLPLACIWFPDAMGSYTGFVGVGRFVSEESSGPGIFFMGWVVLLLPVPICAILYFSD